MQSTPSTLAAPTSPVARPLAYFTTPAQAVMQEAKRVPARRVAPRLGRGRQPARLGGKPVRPAGQHRAGLARRPPGRSAQALPPGGEAYLADVTGSHNSTTRVFRGVSFK